MKCQTPHIQMVSIYLETTSEFYRDSERIL